MSDSVKPHRWLPTRLLHPWDSPGKNIGVGCHFILQCMRVKSESEVAQSSPTLRDPMDWSLPGSSIHWIFQARVLEWGAIPSTYYSQPFGYGSVSSLSKGMNELNQSHVPFDAFQVSDKQQSQLLVIKIPDTTWIPKVFMHPLKKRSYFRRYLAKS